MMSAAPTIPGLCIDGAWSHGKGPLLEVTNPATGAILARVAGAGQKSVDAAVRAAARAFPHWRRGAAAERAALLRRIAAGIREAAQSLIALQMANNGKPRFEAELDVSDAAGTWDYYAGLCEAGPGLDGTPVDLPDAGFAARAVLEPVGVVGLIVPWNFPMVTTSWKLAPALAAGCCAVLKPSELTPLAEIELVRILHEAGIPPGVVNLIQGTGPDTGAALVDHPLIAKLSFTGSTAAGRAVMRQAAETVKRVSLELGGKSALIVCEDADLDTALDLAAGGAFFNAGQMCSATSRILVHERHYSLFLARLGERAAGMAVGDPAMGAAEMGPVIGAGALARIDAMVRAGLADGACLVAGGIALPGKGWFYRPTVLADVRGDSPLWRDEIFGPVACVRPFSKDDEAIRLANDSVYGLVSTVVTADPERARRYEDDLAVGLVWVNAPQVIFPQTAWGGFKQSGLGRELGPWGLRSYQEVKHVVSAV
jgi:betaine-aldehyde dehydrogenase